MNPQPNNTPPTPHQAPDALPGSSVHEDMEAANLALDIQKIENHGTAATSQLQQTSVETGPVRLPISPVTSEQKKSKKVWVFGGIIASILLAFGSGGWAVYALWYQQPDRVINDSIFRTVFAQSVSTDGSIVITDKNGVLAKYNISGGGSYKDGMKGTVSLSLRYTSDTTLTLGMDGMRTPSGDYYLRPKGLRDSYQKFIAEILKNQTNATQASQYVALAGSLFEPYINKLDNQWIHFAMTDIAKYDSTSSAQYDCINKVATDAATKDNLSQIIEIGQIYQKHKIIVYDKNLGTVDGNMGLLVHVDQRALRAMYKDLRNTKLIKELAACDKSGASTIEEDMSDPEAEKNPAQFELWVNEWSHELKRVYSKTVTGDGNDKMTVVTDFSFQANQPISVQPPIEAKTIDELFPELKTQLSTLQLEKI